MSNLEVAGQNAMRSSCIFIHDHLAPAYAQVRDADEDYLGPALLLYRRALRIYREATASGLFVTLSEASNWLLQSETRGNDLVAMIAQNVRQGQLAGERERESEIVPRMIDSEFLLSDSPGGLSRAEIRYSISTASWMGTDGALLDFMWRVEVLGEDAWRSGLDAATEAFSRLYDFCYCNVEELKGRLEPSALRLHDECDWLFDGSVAYINAMVETQALADPDDWPPPSDTSLHDEARPATSSLSIRDLQSARETGSARAMMGSRITGVEGLKPHRRRSNGERFDARVIEACSEVWRTLSATVPPLVQIDLFGELAHWNTRSVRTLLRSSAAPFVVQDEKE